MQRHCNGCELKTVLRGRFGGTTALYGMSMMAVSPLHVTYDMLGRSYALLQLEILLLLIALVCLLENPRPKHWVLFAVACIAAIYTHMWGGILCVAAFLMLGAYFVFGRHWRNLGMLFGIGFFLVVAFSPYVQIFQSQLRCGEYFDLERIHPRLSWHEYFWGTAVGVLGSKLQAAVLCSFAVAAWCMRGAPTGSRMVGATMLGVPLLSIALGLSYSVMQTPVFNPYRQGLLFSLPLILCLAILLRNLQPRWIVYGMLVLLGVNTARLVWSAHAHFNVPIVEQSATKSLAGLALHDKSVYFMEVSYPQSFHTLHAKWGVNI